MRWNSRTAFLVEVSGVSGHNLESSQTPIFVQMSFLYISMSEFSKTSRLDLLKSTTLLQIWEIFKLNFFIVFCAFFGSKKISRKPISGWVPGWRGNMGNFNRKAKARLFLQGLTHEITMIISHSDRHVSHAQKGSAKLRQGMGRAARNTFRTL